MTNVYTRGGSTKKVTLMVTAYDNATYKGKSGGGQFVDAQIVQFGDANQPTKDSKGLPPQLDGHLYHEPATDKAGKPVMNPSTGKQRRNFGQPYTDKQMAQIEQTSGAKTTPLKGNDGRDLGKIYFVECDIMRSKETKEGDKDPAWRMYISNDPAKSKLSPVPEDFEVPENPVDAQFKAIQKNNADFKAEKAAAAKAKEAEAEASKEAPAAEAEAEGATNDGPELG